MGNKFNHIKYLQANPDIAKNWGTPTKAWIHYKMFGKREGRGFEVSAINFSFPISKYSEMIKFLPKRFIFVRPRGDWGDSLTGHGAEFLFRKARLNYTTIKSLPNNKNELSVLKPYRQISPTLVINGGSYFCREHTIFDKQYLLELGKIFEKVIFLPSTYENRTDRNYIRELDKEKFIFFRRDNFGSKEAMPESILAPDTALAINDIICHTKELVKDGFIFRLDKERIKKVIPDSNFDLPSKGKEKTSIIEFFEYINTFKRIHTNRLHVAIAAVMLRKGVYIYPSKTTKVEDFYRTWLKNCRRVSFVKSTYEKYQSALKEKSDEKTMLEKTAANTIASDNNRLSICTFAMNRLNNVKQSIPTILSFMKPDDELIFVDYSDPQESGLWVKGLNDPRVKVVKVDDMKWWHMNHARNIALKFATNSRIFILDVDVILTSNQLIESSRNLKQGFYGRLVNKDKQGNIGSCCFFKEDAMKINGYEEALVGYGHDDSMFYRCLDNLGRIKMEIGEDYTEQANKSRQKRTLETNNIGWDCEVNRRIMDILVERDEFRSNVGRNWGIGGRLI